MLLRCSVAAAAAWFLAACGGSLAAEGMFPLSDLPGPQLQAAGLILDPERIYAPDRVGLAAAVCRLGGCTGVFVSDQGLILTNHHCAYRAIRDACSAERDALQDGFAAAALADELPAAGYTVRVIESHRDVSAQVLHAQAPGQDPLQRVQALQEAMAAIALQAEAERPGRRAEVAEMVPGRSYILFVYLFLEDVRLVYAPPLGVGDFGGEQDNWTWPRHAGDFSLLRAYVAPDGSSAPHAPQNVPYRPRQWLCPEPAGVRPGDFVFLLGYPGSTFRHAASHFLRHQQQTALPQAADWQGWQILTLSGLGGEDPRRLLDLGARLKGLRNSWKNTQAKLDGIARLDLVAAKARQERDMLAAADPQAAVRYAALLDSLGAYYAKMDTLAPYAAWLSDLRRSPQALQAALTLWEGAQERLKPQERREPPYREGAFAQTVENLRAIARTFDSEADSLLLAELFRRGGAFAQARALAPLAGCLGPEGAAAAADLVSRVLGGTRLLDEARIAEASGLSAQDLRDLGDPLLELAQRLYPAFDQARLDAKRRKGELDHLHAAWIEARSALLGGRFVPDANGTLRLTYGQVEGYRDRDGVWQDPLATGAGLLAKATGREPYALPDTLRPLLARRGGPFCLPDGGEIPVNLLYGADTVGGSSGSPVLDGRGRLVGLNFDRPWEAVVNDYAWDRSYSRSIGVDIRYILWILLNCGGQRLLQEMGAPVPTGG